jgi:hypothetical protein
MPDKALLRLGLASRLLGNRFTRSGVLKIHCEMEHLT